MDVKKKKKLHLGQKKASKAQKMTKLIAIISIIVSAVVGIGSLIFNYLTYTNERKVEIINKNPIPAVIKEEDDKGKR